MQLRELVLRMRHSKFILKGSDFGTFDFNSFCVSACGWVLLKTPLPLHPDSAGLPNSGGLPPQPAMLWTDDERWASWGRGTDS